MKRYTAQYISDATGSIKTYEIQACTRDEAMAAAREITNHWPMTGYELYSIGDTDERTSK